MLFKLLNLVYIWVFVIMNQQMVYYYIFRCLLSMANVCGGGCLGYWIKVTSMLTVNGWRLFEFGVNPI